MSLYAEDSIHMPCDCGLCKHRRGWWRRRNVWFLTFDFFCLHQSHLIQALLHAHCYKAVTQVTPASLWGGGIQHCGVRTPSLHPVLKLCSFWHRLWFSFPDDGHRIRQTLWPEEGHERNLQGEIPPHKAHTQQDKEVKLMYKCRVCHSNLNVITWPFSFPLLVSSSFSFFSWCSLKREIRKLAQECGYEELTVAMAFVYFEKLVLQGKLNKQNRKLCAGACVLLAAKIGGDLKKHEVKLLIDVSFLKEIKAAGHHLCVCCLRWKYFTFLNCKQRSLKK